MATPTVGSTNPSVASAMASATSIASKRSGLDHDLTAGGGVEPAQVRVAPEPAGHQVDALELTFEHFRCFEECSGVGDQLCDGAERPGPVDVLAVGRRRQASAIKLDPLVTGGRSRGSRRRGRRRVEGVRGTRGAAALAAVARSHGTVVVGARGVVPRQGLGDVDAQRPDRGEAGDDDRPGDGGQPVQRTVAAQQTPHDGAAPGWRVGRVSCRSGYGTDPDANMKSEGAQAKDSLRASPVSVGLSLPRPAPFARRSPSERPQDRQPR